MIASSRRRNCNRVRSVQMLRRIEASLCLRLVIYCNPCHNLHRCRQVAILPLFWDVNRVEANWHLKRMVSCNNLLHLLSPSSGSYLRGTSPIAMNIAQRRRIEMLAWSTHSLRPVRQEVYELPGSKELHPPQRRNQTVHFPQVVDAEGTRSWRRVMVEYS